MPCVSSAQRVSPASVIRQPIRAAVVLAALLAGSACVTPSQAAWPGWGKPKGPATAATSQPVTSQPSLPPLGPPTLWMPSEDECLIDFDTDRTASPPEDVAGEDEMKAWLEAEGIDARWHADRSTGQLVLLKAAVHKLDSGAWDNARSDTIAKELSALPATGDDGVIPCGKDSLPLVLLVRTRESGLGIVQVRRVRSRSQAGVEVQYRMLEQPEQVGADLSDEERQALLETLRSRQAAAAAELLRLQAMFDVQDSRIARAEAMVAAIGRRIALLEAAAMPPVDAEAAGPQAAATEPAGRGAATAPASATQASAGEPVDMGAADTQAADPEAVSSAPAATQPVATQSAVRKAAQSQASASQSQPAVNLYFEDFPSRFADGECLQGLPRPTVLKGEGKPPFCKSDQPVLFDMHHSPMPTKLLLDESGGTGSGYDTLYLDFDDDGDFTEHPVYRPTPFAGTMFPDGEPVVLYFRHVHIPRNLKQNRSAYVQIYIEQLPGWPEDITALHPRIIPQRWAVGTVMLGDTRVPAALIDRGWDDTFTDKRGINVKDPRGLPRGDYLVLGIEGEPELLPCDLKDVAGSARVVLNEYLAVGGKVYRIHAERQPEGVRLELEPVSVPMGMLKLSGSPKGGRLVLIGTRTVAIIHEPGEAISLPADTYVSSQLGDWVYTVEPEGAAASQP